MAVFESEFKVRVTDIDQECKITNKAILDLFQNVAGMHSESIHYGINDIKETKLSWIILNWKVKVIKRPIYNESIIAKTWIRSVNKFFTNRDFELYDMEGNILAIGTSKWGLINIDTKKLVHISEDLINLYGTNDKKVFINEDIKKLEEPSNYVKSVNYKILRKDIDINKHVHNLYYLDIAYEALPENVYTDSSLDNIEIEYKKQIKLEDKIKAYYSFENEEHVIAIKSDDNVLHAIIKLF